jgi:beta-lactamase regulating signal transducer with metallopeptidase domain
MMAFLALHLWQSTLVLLAAWVLALACRRNTAATRYWIWFASSVKFLVPFAWLQWLGDQIGRSFAEPTPVDPALIAAAAGMFVPPFGLAGIPEHVPAQIWNVIAVIWALGAAALILRWFVQWRAVHAAVASVPAECMDLPVPVRITSGDLTPGVFGVFRPSVILPRAIMGELGPQQLGAVLAHELCHVRRRDNVTAAIHKCVEVIFWFHPLVWWIGANLLREREAACDESVIDEGHEQAVYAESILRVCRVSVASRFSGVAASNGGDLALRMSSIMSAQRAQPVGNARLALLLLLAMVVCYGPIAAGVISGAFREASNSGPITFDAIRLGLSNPGWWRSTKFDPSAGQLALRNVSLRDLILLAYPASSVNSDPELIDHVSYDIEARWHAAGGASERHVYRQLLDNILRTNSNLQIYVNDRCDQGCDPTSAG